jgi:hypothetical protein
MILAKASLNYDHSFSVLTNVIMIVNDDCKTFKVQATGVASLVTLLILIPIWTCY